MEIRLEIIVDDVIVETIEDLEDWNLDKNVAAGLLSSEVIEAVQRAQKTSTGSK